MTQTYAGTVFPRFAHLLASEREPDALSVMFKDLPVVRMQLFDVQRELRNIRGVYESGSPDIHTEIALKYGPKYTLWLTRDPDWRAARRVNAPLVLIEMTPILIKRDNKERYLHARWIIEVIGEREQRTNAFSNIIAQIQIAPRFERAG